MFKPLWTSRELILNLVKRDLKTRYKSSVLGFFWSIGKPLLIMLVLLAVFTTIVRFKMESQLPYALHLLGGILPWFFLTGAISESLYSIVANGQLIKKIKITTEVFPVSSVLSNLVHFLLALIVLFFFMLAFKVLPNYMILALPVVILIHAFFIISIALIVSSLNVFYRDVASITEVILNAWFYLTPIIYPINLVKKLQYMEDIPKLVKQLAPTLANLYMLNPMAAITAAYRRVLFAPVLKAQPEIPDKQLLVYLLIAIAFSLILYVIGRKIFTYYSRRFADEV